MHGVQKMRVGAWQRVWFDPVDDVELWNAIAETRADASKVYYLCDVLSVCVVGQWMWC